MYLVHFAVQMKKFQCKTNPNNIKATTKSEYKETA